MHYLQLHDERAFGLYLQTVQRGQSKLLILNISILPSLDIITVCCSVPFLFPHIFHRLQFTWNRPAYLPTFVLLAAFQVIGYLVSGALTFGYQPVSYPHNKIKSA